MHEDNKFLNTKNISAEDAIKAIKTILDYVGDDSSREGLINTPKRVIKSYSELFAGYKVNVADIFNAKFTETATFDDYVILRDISFKSFCEHHMLPMVGKVSIAYLPNDCVIGISKLARVVKAFSQRLQIQEKMTAEIAEAIQLHLNPKGVAVKVSAIHYCMVMRGVEQESSFMDTLHFTGVFKEDYKYRSEFLNLIK